LRRPTTRVADWGNLDCEAPWLPLTDIATDASAHLFTPPLAPLRQGAGDLAALAGQARHTDARHLLKCEVLARE